MSQKGVRHTDTHTDTQLLRPYKSDDCRFSYQHIPRFVYVFAYFVYNPTVSRLMLLLTAFPNVNDQAITPSERLVALSLRVYLALSGCVWGLVGSNYFQFMVHEFPHFFVYIPPYLFIIEEEAFMSVKWNDLIGTLGRGDGVFYSWVFSSCSCNVNFYLSHAGIGKRTSVCSQHYIIVIKALYFE